MDKKEFFRRLTESLKGLPQDERSDAITYYDEMISDKMEAGMTESEAVDSLGDIYKLRAYIMAGSVENSMRQKADKSPQAPKAKSSNPIKSFFIVLALCSSPLLIVLGAVTLVVLVSLIASFAAVAISLFAGSGYALIMSVVNTIEVAGSQGAAAGAMSFFALLFAAALLLLLGVLMVKLSVIVIKLIVRMFAKMVKRNNKQGAAAVVAADAV